MANSGWNLRGVKVAVGAKLKRLSLAIILVSIAFVTVVPAGKVLAARASITEEKAYELCKSFHADFNKKKHWVKYKKGYKCMKIKVSASVSGQSDFRVRCQGEGDGIASVRENGMINCMWPDGFKKEDKDKNKNNATLEVETDKKCVSSSIIWNEERDGKKYFCDSSKGAGVYEILLIVLNILTGLVGVLGVLGIVISGITYLTARDDAERVAKAKKRIVQIVIGLAIFAVLYVGLQWLIPGGIFGGA